MIYLKILVTIRKVLVTVRKIGVTVRKVLARWLSITSHHYSPILRMPQIVCEMQYAGKHYAWIYACVLGFFFFLYQPWKWSKDLGLLEDTVISGQHLVQLYSQYIWLIPSFLFSFLPSFIPLLPLLFLIFIKISGWDTRLAIVSC